MTSVSSIIMIVSFIIVVLLILSEKINRAIVAIAGAVVTYYTLVFIDGKDFSVVVGIIFGTSEDGFVNLKSLILIFGMMVVIGIAEEAGVFQFLAAYVIKKSNGNPISLLVIFCFLAVICSAILNNIVTVMMLIPLTIMISRILNTNPTPYILSEAVLVNVGGTIFSISSIPNILITTESGITFPDFLFNVGLFSILVVILTVPLFLFLYKPDLTYPDDELVEILAEFDVWNVVQSKALFFTSLLSIIALIGAFFIIPPEVLSPDMIAITIAIMLLFITYFQDVDGELILKKLDYQLILYLIGIFAIAGGLEITGVINTIGTELKSIGHGFSPLVQVLFIMWIAAILSSVVDNIPITKILLPIVHDFIPATSSPQVSKNYYYGLAFGANWGDNLTPLGDNILIVNLAQQNKRPIKIFDFWRLGFVTTVYQLILATLYFTLLFNLLLGIILIGIILCSIIILMVLSMKITWLSQFKLTIRKTIVG